MISVIIPAKNEAASIGNLVLEIKGVLPEAQIIVVDDGSSDGTGDIAKKNGAEVFCHPYSKGNGASIKTGARVATGDQFLFLDADGQHPVKNIPPLIEKMNKDYDMVVGAREADTHASLGRRIANGIYNRMASFVTEQKVLDLTSGFRLVNAEKFKEFLYLLPNSFSYPTTITMAFFRAGYSVDYLPYRAEQRDGKSHIDPLRDGLRFLLIIFKVATLYSPLKVFFPIAFLQVLIAIGYYLYTYLSEGRLTNMVVVMLVAATGTFLMGLLSEQITTLLYKKPS